MNNKERPFDWLHYYNEHPIKTSIFNLGLGDGASKQEPVFENPHWTYGDKIALVNSLSEGNLVKEIARQLGKSPWAIFDMLKQIGRIPEHTSYTRRIFAEVSIPFTEEQYNKAMSRILASSTQSSTQTATSTQEKQDMSKVNANHILSLMQENFTTVKVTFNSHAESERQYTYKARNEMDLKEGDFCIVLARGRYAVVEVKKVDLVPDINLDANYEYDWIVQKVDTVNYLATLEKEKKFIDTYLAIEKEKKRQAAVEDFKKYLPEGSKGATLLIQAIEELNK